jgi:penicillin amidase
MIDDHDFFVEEVDSVARPTRYRLDGRWIPIAHSIDTILVKGSDPVLLSVYATRRGPVINRIEPSAKWSTSLISMRWTGHEVSNDAYAFLLLNEAQSWREFNAALRHFTVPSQSFVYADTAGNIGYRTAGRVPIRRSRHALLPVSGNRSANDWQGFVPFNQMPSSFNPKSGFIVSANNAIVGSDYPYHLSHIWEPPWRAQRINEVLRGSDKVSIEEMQRLQQDVVSPLAKQIVPLIIDVLSDTTADEHFPQYISYLRTWDFRMGKEQVAPAIFESLYRWSIHETFVDEMGEDLLGVYDTLAGMRLTALQRLLDKPESSWFDDIRTPERENRDDILRRAFRLALNDLQERLGTDIKRWRWERLHTLTFAHSLGVVPALAPIFNLGPYPVSGSHSTVNVGYFLLDGSFKMTVGASLRQIFDLSDHNNTRSVMPPGQSGQVFHRNYDDQISLWLNGSYKIVPIDPDLIVQRSQSILVLQP